MRDSEAVLLPVSLAPPFSPPHNHKPESLNGAVFSLKSGQLRNLPDLAVYVLSSHQISEGLFLSNIPELYSMKKHRYNQDIAQHRAQHILETQIP